MSRESEASTDAQEYFEERRFSWERRKLGLELRHKYELYFPTLTFTLLGLAIQTAKKSDIACLRNLEFSGWAALLVSGLISLYGLELLWKREVAVGEYENRRLHQVSYETLIADITKTEKNLRHFQFARFCIFILGLVLLMFSRGWLIS